MVRVVIVFCTIFVSLSTTVALRAENILFFAAASTADALNAAINAYPSKKVRIRVSYASSGALARQIENGAPVALFLSASPLWTKRLTAKNLLAKDRSSPFLGNRLVLAIPQTGKLKIKIEKGFSLASMLGSERLAIADPAHAPAGIYARESLKSLGVWKDISRKTARATDVRSALALIQRAEVPAGIVYRSDVVAVKNVKIIGTFPKNTHPPIIYPLSIVKQFETPAVRKFFDYLRTPVSVEIFQKFGFEVK